MVGNDGRKAVLRPEAAFGVHFSQFMYQTFATAIDLKNTNGVVVTLMPPTR
jgi:hypothetical protein